MKHNAILGLTIALGLARPAVAQGPASPPAPPAPAAPAAAPPQSSSGTPSLLDAINGARWPDQPVAPGGFDPAILRAEVLLDRAHASPGVIDGKGGENFSHALGAFEAERHLPAGKSLDTKTWSALLATGGPPVVMSYTLTAADVAGPFYPDLPSDYAKLAQLPTIGYRSPAQKIGAKFHMGEDLLAALNPGVDLATAGSRILVAAVDDTGRRETIGRIIVDKTLSQVRAYDEAGRVVLAVPATIGSTELPSPSGTYKVKGVSWNPVYYYNPEKNFVQGRNHEKLRLPPGPNNPVGSVFIALTKPTYGLHGTPDPSKIDKTASHGCVRMTNWDATAMAQLVHNSRNRVVVSFTGKRS